ncbi:MAG: putative aliphatic sulfonates-binding protein [Proteobacteria bacterium]|nr:putative aliphatic sulfonates-binding protein [Pseudomonadota bacterium]
MWRTLFSAVLVAALCACQKSPSASDTVQGLAQPPEKVTIAYTVQPQSTLIHVAVAKGYFAAEGLEVQPLIHTFGKAALQSVLDDKADFATVAETPIMFNVLKGEKLFVLANIEASGMNNATVARKDAGIAAAADLPGKRVGFTPGTTSDFFLDSILTANGLTRQAIQPVALKPEEMQAAILDKRVDAVSTWNYPLTEIKRQLGANGLVIFDRDIYTETFNLAAKQDFVQRRPETVKRLLRAVVKAESFVAQHPEEAQGILASATKTDNELVREVWSAFNYRVVLNQSLIITLEDETRWAMKHKLTEQMVMPDYRNFIHADSLRAVKPDAVKFSR